MITIDEMALRRLVYEECTRAIRDNREMGNAVKLPDAPEQSEVTLPESKPLKYEDFMDKLRTHLREQDDTAAATKAAKNIMFEMFECEKFNQVEQEDLASLLEAITNG